MSEIKLPVPLLTFTGGYTAEQMRAAILEERERCAKICESMTDSTDDSDHGRSMDFAYETAAIAIRSQ